MIISFTNVIGAIRSLGEAAQVITTNLKMWLGFETSETLGKEEVRDGDFSDGTTGWLIEDGWNVTNNRLNVDTDDGNLFARQNSILEIGKTYLLTLDVSLDVGEIKFESGGTPNFIITTSDTTISHTFVATLADVVFRRNVIPTRGYIDNISIKELTQITPDKSGNNNVGELFTGKALDFDGAGDYLDVSGFSMSGNNATFAFWAYIRDNARADYFFDFHSSTTRFVFGFGQASQKLAVYSGGWQDFGDPPQDQWVRIVLTINGTTAKCFVDGVQLGTDKTISTYDFSSPTTIHIGARYTPETIPKWYDGVLSDFQVYNSVWLTDDIAYDYANPNKLAIDNPNTSLSVTNLKGYWALSEGDGLVAYDSGTNLEEEEVVNGDFATPQSDWTFANGWGLSNNTAIYNGTGAQYAKLVQPLTTVAGRTYQVTFTLNELSGSNVKIGLATSANAFLTGATNFTALGTHTITMTATASDNRIVLQVNSATMTCTISNVSVREVTASDHGGIVSGATYVDAQPRIPQLGMMNWSKGSNLFPYSEDFTEWIISPSTSQAVLAPTEAAPYGQGDVYEVTMQSSESDAYIRYSTTNATLTSSTHSVWVKQAPSGSATHIRLTNNNRAAWNTGTSEKIALTSSWQRLETTDSITGNRFTIIGSADVSGNQDPDCIGKALVYGAQLVEGSSAGAYRFTDGGATSNSTVIPNPTIPTQDIFGNAVRDRLNSFNLDGSGYAEVADDDSLNMSSGFSTSFWVKLDEGSTTTDYDFLVCKGRGVGGTNTAYGFGTTYYNNTIIATINTSVSKYQAISPSQTSTGQWVFVCVTYEPNTLLGLKLYLDDNSPNSITVSGTVDESHNLNVGRDSSFVTTRQSRNIISDVLFYDSVLTSDEVENNYNAGSSAHRN